MGLTSGTPSQNVDLAGLSFPRCLGVRLHPDYLERYHLVGMQARWMSYDDKYFKKPLGKDFAHEDTITREGWARYYFKGIYARDVAYVKLEIVNPQTNMLIREFFFQFTKAYQMSLDARYYITDPILGEKIVKNGTLVELVRKRRKKDGATVYVRGHAQFKEMKASIVSVDTDDVSKSKYTQSVVESNAITQTNVRYSEKCKAIFLVTPPHMMKYAKLILILIRQLVDLNFDKSYMTKSSQKPSIFFVYELYVVS